MMSEGLVLSLSRLKLLVTLRGYKVHPLKNKELLTILQYIQESLKLSLLSVRLAAEDKTIQREYK